MSTRKQVTDSSHASRDTDLLIDVAARRGVVLGARSAQRLSSMGLRHARQKVQDVCRVVHAGEEEDVELNFSSALRRLNACGGDVEKAVRRLVWGDLETREGMPEAILYAADNGVDLEPSSIYALFKTRGRQGTLRYIADLAEIMDEASRNGIDCSQALATRRLSLTGGDAEAVIAGLIAEQRRRLDRLVSPCGVVVPPRALRDRANAYAGCGCPSCVGRLAAQLEHYIAKMVAKLSFARLDAQEARGEANLVLIMSVEAWPGGNFTGWFAEIFTRHVARIYKSRTRREAEMPYADASGISSYDGESRMVSWWERLPDLSKDVLTIVLLRERVAEKELELHRGRVERTEEFHVAAAEESAARRGRLRLLPSDERARDRGPGPALERRAA